MPTKLLRKQFLLTEEENRQIEAKAKKEGLSVSNFTRQLYGLNPLEAGGSRRVSNLRKESNKKKET